MTYEGHTRFTHSLEIIFGNRVNGGMDLLFSVNLSGSLVYKFYVFLSSILITVH